MYKNQADAVRDWLKAYVKNEQEIDALLDALRTIKGRAVSIGAQEISDMPKSPSMADAMAEYMVRVEQMEMEIDRRVEAHNRARRAIEGVLERMESEKQKNIIRCRYIYGMEWTEIVRMSYGKRDDYLKKYRAFQKRVYRDHDKALLEMARNWSKK